MFEIYDEEHEYPQTLEKSRWILYNLFGFPLHFLSKPSRLQVMCSVSALVLVVVIFGSLHSEDLHNEDFDRIIALGYFINL